MMRLFSREDGNATIEMTLVGLPMIFVLISTFEIARGMWIYDTLAYSVREATRYAIVHGQNCSVSPNSCEVTVAMVMSRLSNAGVGLPSDHLDVTLQSLTDNINCNPVSACFTNNTVFPSSGGNGVGNPITVSAKYRFTSAISMFWPRAGRPVSFAAVNLPASSTDYIQF
ncbi:MAG: TadE/TadG family type IV pilus assembly protein [Bryobacteraceae bacterium]